MKTTIARPFRPANPPGAAAGFAYAENEHGTLFRVPRGGGYLRAQDDLGNWDQMFTGGDQGAAILLGGGTSEQLARALNARAGRLRGILARERSHTQPGDDILAEIDAENEAHEEHCDRAEAAAQARGLAHEVEAVVGSDGASDIRVIVDAALADDPNVTVDEVVEIVREARREAAADRA